MKRIDKMVRQAKKMRRKTINPVHIIVEGYCSACKGVCKYRGMSDSELSKLTDETLIFFYGEELLEDYDDKPVVINIDIPRGGGVDESEKEG